MTTPWFGRGGSGDLGEYWYFVAERQAVWHRRFVERWPKPWTTDPVIRNTKFCNIYRELDPGTQFVTDELLPYMPDFGNALFNVMLYRLIGRAETLREVGFIDYKTYKASSLDFSLRAVAEKHPVFTGAYIVAAYSNMGGRDKIDNVCRLFEVIAKNVPWMCAQIAKAVSSEAVYDVLLSQPGFGNFLAYQVLADMRYPVKTCYPPLPFSNDDWVSAGPGAQRGLRMLGVTDKALYLPAMKWLRDNQEAEFARLSLTFNRWEGKRLDLANIQGTLCEYHKYHKVKNGTGHARASYPGEGTSQTVEAEAFW
jgi:alpha-glutamyl/putrescinyl thymine pyrophosphorylase clade 1